MASVPQGRPWLDACGPLPTDRPFTLARARTLGVDRRRLARWVETGRLRRPLAGVYHAAELSDCLALRVDCLRLVVPPDCVVTDRTAAWLLGAPRALAPGDHLVVPPVSLFRPPGYRLRNGLSSSGERRLARDDVLRIEGLCVTTPLRTACDLGRLLHRDQAVAGLDAMARIGRLAASDLLVAAARFAGYRGVIQLRALAPLADGRAESPGESILRLRWLDCGELPRPTPQVRVPGPAGPYFLDLAVEELRYAAEYDGAQWHGPEQRAHDGARRRWIREELGWELDVFTARNIHGRGQDADVRLRRGVLRARRRYGGR